MTGYAAPSLGKRLRVTVCAPWADLATTRHRVPGSLSPLNSRRLHSSPVRRHAPRSCAGSRPEARGHEARTSPRDAPDASQVAPRSADDPARAAAKRRSPGLRGPLLTRLFSEPFVEHGAREADVPADPMAGQAAGPHGLVDPARPDVQIPSGLIRAKQPILLQRSLCRWCCCFHTDIDPNAAEPANGFLRRTLGPPHALACQGGRGRRPERSPGDRRTTAGERCRERCPAVATS